MAATVAPAVVTSAGQRALSQRLIDLGATVCAAWLMFGLYLDGWAHNTSLPDSFWTPWHGVLYSGYGALALFLALVAGTRLRAGLPPRSAVPEGYAPSVLGALVFGFGGVFDMLWHTFIGIERGLDTLFSPSHLMLAIGIVLLVSGPLRSVWRRGALARPSFDSAIALASILMLFLMFTFMFQFSTPFAFTPGTPGDARNGELGQIRALFGVLTFTAVLVSLVLLALREGVLLPGSITVLLLTDAAAMMLMRSSVRPEQREVMLATAIAAGIVGDVLLWRLRPGRAALPAVRILATALPGVFFGIYFGLVALRIGTWWTPHAVTGMAVLAGLAGLVLSYLVFPRRETPGA